MRQEYAPYKLRGITAANPLYRLEFNGIRVRDNLSESRTIRHGAIEYTR